MRLCFATLGCPDWSIQEIVENAIKYGFESVELRVGGQQHIDTDMPPSERAHVKSIIETAGLAIASISGYSRAAGDNKIMLDEQQAILNRNIDLACDIGSPYVRAYMGEADSGRISLYGISALRASCEYALSRGVMVLMETHDTMSAGKLAKDLLGKINSDGLGILWDIHHTFKSGETPSETYDFLGSAIKHVHIKDAHQDRTLCLTGEGVLPIKEVIHVLNNNHYHGFLSFEWEKMWVPTLCEPEIAFPHYVAYMKSL